MSNIQYHIPAPPAEQTRRRRPPHPFAKLRHEPVGASMFVAVGPNETNENKRIELARKAADQFKIAYNCIRNLNAVFRTTGVRKHIIMTNVVEGNIVGLRAWVQEK